jgi:uncharacterized membrane protein YadS
VLITLALAAIGLRMHLGATRRAGHRPLVLGTRTRATVACPGLLLQIADGTWSVPGL